MPLKLFRRHQAGCDHPKDFRIYENDSAKRTGRKQCNCPIYAEGTLHRNGRKQYLRPKATGERDWKAARAVADGWERPESGTVSACPAVASYSLVPIAEAVDHCLSTLAGKNNSPEQLRQFRQLLVGRLIPFASSRGIQFIQQMDNAKSWADFKASWRNENPTHNRKAPRGQPPAAKPLKPSTSRRMVEQLRTFLKLCVSREWLSDNWASRDHGMTVSVEVEPKEPFAPEELAYIYDATGSITDGRGFRTKRTGQQNARELLVFVWMLRYTGLRISDVVKMEVGQLAPFVCGSYTHAIYCHPKKTRKKRDGNFVHIPIQSDNLPGHPNLVAALQALTLKNGRYFFLGGKGSLRTNVSSWRKRVTRLLSAAAKAMERDGKTL